MEVVFLDRNTFKYKDHSAIGGEFELVLDLIVAQKSNFTLNRTDLNIAVGDIVVLKDSNISFIGIIETITSNSNHTLKIQVNDFKEIFNVKVPAESFSGDVCEFLVNKIKQVFTNCSDEKQNLKYLNFVVNTSKEGTLSYEENTFINIKELMELIAKTYHIIIKFKVSFLRGRFNYINIIIDELNIAYKIKDNFKAISEISINDSKENQVNKIIFYPKKENRTHLSIENFYLLNDGTISKDKDNELRSGYVNFETDYYSDDEFNSLETKALGILLKQAKDHEITFKLDVNNKIYVPLSNLFLGVLIEFYTKNKIYHTVLTQIKYKNNFKNCIITLGEHRTNLTDKIKLMNKHSSVSSSSTSGVLIEQNTDGGVY